MDKYINKAKSKFNKFIDERNDNSNDFPAYGTPQAPHHHHHPHQEPITSQGDRPCTIQPPTPLDVLRYRYHHGCNLGAVFVLEKWLFPSMFPKACPNNVSSELEGVKASVKVVGVEEARKKFEAHWTSALTDADLDWLVGVARCTTIRLPIGYFTLGPQFCNGTPFEQYSAVYENCWSHVKSLTQRARARGIGIVLDFHGLPGGANKQEHSGTNSGAAGHWKSTSHRAQSQRCLEFIAHEVRDSSGSGGFGEGVAGIQVCNEADWEAPGLYEWYDSVIAAIQRIDPSVPVLISDAWNLDKCLDYCARKNSVYVGAPTGPVVVDTHFYWAFTDADKRKSPQEIVQEAWGKLGQLDGREGDVLKKGAVACIVGEYSCVLTEDSWAKKGGEEKDDLVRQFGQAQSARYQQRALGSYFWTYKMAWMPGGEWGFKSCVQRAAITAPWLSHLSTPDVHQRLQTALSQRDSRLHAAASSHRAYWDAHAPGTPFEHWRYDEGWKTGFDDAAAFFGMRVNGGLGAVERVASGEGNVGGDKIGNLEVWVRRRIVESGMGGGFVWEFEQGVRRGVGEFCEAAGGL